MLAGTGRFFILGLHENISNWDDFTRKNLQSQHNIGPAKRDGVFPALPDGTGRDEKRPGKHSFHINGT